VGSARPAALRAAPPSTTEPPCSLPGTRDPWWSWGNCNLQETRVILVRYTGFPANVLFNQVVD
jgi:hypothetical protein